MTVRPEYKALLFFLLLAATFLVFSPCLENGWTNWDDPDYILLNENIRDFSAKGIARLFNPKYMALDTYTPLTLVSFAAEYALVETQPFLYHLNNVLLHLLNVLLTFLVFRYLTGSFHLGLFIAALFALHPMHVESVAWVTERKDLLFSFFYLLGALFYLFHLRRSAKTDNEPSHKGNGFYLLTVLSFLLSILAKPQAVSLPAVLVLIEYCVIGRVSRKTIAKMIPFVLIAIFFAGLTLNYMLPNKDTWNWWDRTVLSGYAVFLHLKHLFYPFQQSAYYPFPTKVNGHFEPTVYLGSVFVALLFSSVLYALRKDRLMVFGWLFFFVSIGLSLHFVKVNSAIIYDRFTYLAYSGLFLMIGIRLKKLLENKASGPTTLLIVSIVLIGFSYTSYARCKVWKNDETLWTDVLHKYPGAKMPSINLGYQYRMQHRLDEALTIYQACAEMNPTDPVCINSKGLIHRSRNEFDLALQCFDQSAERDSNYYLARANRGMLLSFLGDDRKALNDMNALVRINPDTVTSYLFRAIVLENLKMYERATADHTILIQREPFNAALFSARGLVHWKSGNATAALNDYDQAIQLNPKFAEVYYRRAKLYAASGNIDQALSDARRAVSLGYELPPEFAVELGTFERPVP